MNVMNLKTFVRKKKSCSAQQQWEVDLGLLHARHATGRPPGLGPHLLVGIMEPHQEVRRVKGTEVLNEGRSIKPPARAWLGNRAGNHPVYTGLLPPDP